MVLIATPISAKKRVKLFDITVPQPKKGQMERLSDIRIRGRYISPQVFASTEVIFYLNKKGTVDSLGWSHPEDDSLVFRPYRDSLLATKFEAGKIQGKKSSFALVVRFFALGGRLGDRGVADFPVNADGELLDYALALKSLANYGCKAPELVVCPPYYFRKPDIEDSHKRLYDFAVIHVTLDSTGSPRERSIYYASDEGLGEMALITSGWAEYSPASANGSNVESEGFLFIRFFREIAYPVESWKLADLDLSNDDLEQMRVMWIPGRQFGDIAPVQRANQDLSIRIPLSFSQGSAKKAQLRVDSKGRVQINQLSGLTGKVDMQITLDKLKSIPFYPAFRLSTDPSIDMVTLKFLSVLGRLNLLPQDSTTYLLQTEFIDKYNVVERNRAQRRR